jgi:hypothetical protein
MNDRLKPLPVDDATRDALPLGYARILFTEDVLDERTTSRLTLQLPKYRHASAFVRRPDKPISKPDL